MDMLIGDYLGRRAVYSPDAIAFIDEGKPDGTLQLSFAQANQRADSLACHFQDMGVQVGDRVAILAKDGVEHLDCFFACGKIGAIHTALNWRLHHAETTKILQNTTPKIILYSHDFCETITTIKTQCSDAIYINLDSDEHGDLDFSSLISEQNKDNNNKKPNYHLDAKEEDIVALIFTGGTTGLPKAAQISHRMIAWNTLNTVIHDLRHEDVYLNVFPLFHTGGLFVYTLPQVILGGTTVLIRQFDPTKILEWMQKWKVTVFAGVPTMYQMLCDAPNWMDSDLSSLRFCTSGGAPLPIPLVQKYQEQKGILFKQGFGMTEFGPGVFALPPQKAIEKAGSIGLPNFFVQAKIVDDNNRELPQNTAGELILRGPSFSSGYYNNQKATQEVVDADGFFHTGDMAIRDEDGFFRIVDRKKDMFISGGENVYPAEIEAVLHEIPEVSMCAVVGIPDAKWGEVGLACVVCHEEQNKNISTEDILKYLKQNLAKYKVPKDVVFLKELPLSGAGKILKRELRQRRIDGLI